MLNIPKNWDCLVENIMETHYEYDDEKSPHHSMNGKSKDLQQKLKSINYFILALVMSYVGSCFKLIRIYWYKNMKPFRTNLKLVWKKFVYGMHGSFLGDDSSSNVFMLCGMRK